MESNVLSGASLASRITIRDRRQAAVQRRRNSKWRTTFADVKVAFWCHWKKE